MNTRSLGFAGALATLACVSASHAQQWAVVPFTPGVFNLKSVWARSATQVYAGSATDSRVFAYDGTTWTTQFTSLPSSGVIDLTGDATTTYACGGFASVSTAPAGNSSWTSQNASVLNVPLNTITRSVAATYAAGSSGRYGFFLSGAWTGVSTSLSSVAWRGSAAFGTNFVLVGDSGSVVTGSLTSWTVRASNTTDTLYGVSLAGSTAVAVGANARIDVSTNSGTSWSPYNHALSSGVLRDVAGGGSVFLAVGDGGVILRSTDSGASWTADASGVVNNLTAVWISSDATRAFAVGEGGMVLTWPPPAPGSFTVTSPTHQGFVETATPTITWSASLNALNGYTVTIDDSSDFASPVLTAAGVVGTSYAVPAGVLGNGQIYYLRVASVNSTGTTIASPSSVRFAVIAPPSGCEPDFNHDGNVDQDDVVALINVISGGGCP